MPTKSISMESRPTTAFGRTSPLPPEHTATALVEFEEFERALEFAGLENNDSILSAKIRAAVSRLSHGDLPKCKCSARSYL